MTEVKRYNFFTGPGEGRNADFVLASDYDAALAHEAALREESDQFRESTLQMVDELIALREALAEEKWTSKRLAELDDATIAKLGVRLKAAEQRDAELVELLNFSDHYLQEASFNSIGDVIDHTQAMRDKFREKISAALGHAESGSDHD